MTGARDRWLTACSSAGAFAVPGLALWLPSGYSYGAVLLLLTALASVALWARRPLAPEARWLALAYCAMGAVWLLDVSTSKGWSSFDRPAKYLAVLPCLMFAMAYPPRVGFLWAGVAVGAAGSGLIAFYQTDWFSPLRASGFTNAIQYGNLSMLLAMLCGVLLVVQWSRWRVWQRCGWLLAMGMGFSASLLSGSRGGWLALALAVPVCSWIMARNGLRGVGRGLAVLLLFGAAVAQLPGVQLRVQEGVNDVQHYLATGDGRTSMGHRLAHWQIAISMGLEKPLLGWGTAGYEQEKARRVAAGLAHPIVMQYEHAHNEVLDLLAKRGLVGVLVLLLFYGVPLAVFWPTPARVCDDRGVRDAPAYSLCMAGLLLPLSYIAFGLTQVFFAHNSGNMFYLFMCLLLLAALLQRRRELRSDAAGNLPVFPD